MVSGLRGWLEYVLIAVVLRSEMHVCNKRQQFVLKLQQYIKCIFGADFLAAVSFGLPLNCNCMSHVGCSTMLLLNFYYCSSSSSIGFMVFL